MSINFEKIRKKYKEKSLRRKEVQRKTSLLEEWHPDKLPDELPDSYGIKIMP